MKILRAIRRLRRSVGLAPVRASDYIAPAVGILAFGVLAGAGIALLFAPMSGMKLREEMENRFAQLRSRFLLKEGEEGGARRNNAKQVEQFPRI